MKKIGIIAIVGALVIIGGYWLFTTDKIFIENCETIAKGWVVNQSPTYVFDGSNLELVNREDDVFTFKFISSHGGYGDRTDQIVTQAITLHEMVVVVEDEVVVEAITDGVFSEIQNKLIVPDEESIVLPVYFGRMGEEEKLFPISRMISEEDNLTTALFEALISGPTKIEIERGLYSMINPKTEIRSIRTERGTIYIDFSNELQEGVAGSASVLFIRSQIEKTGKMVPGINEIVISIEGETEGILQP